MVNSKQKQGNYSVIFDATNFASGIYYYQLKVGNYAKKNVADETIIETSEKLKFPIVITLLIR